MVIAGAPYASPTRVASASVSASGASATDSAPAVAPVESAEASPPPGPTATASLASLPVEPVIPPAVSPAGHAPPAPLLPPVVPPAVHAPTDDLGQVALPAAPALPTAPAPVPPLTVLTGPDPVPLAAVPSAQRPPSLEHQQQRPHSPAPRDERATSRRRHDSPRRRGSQANWGASRGGRGGWWGGRGRGGSWVYDQPMTMADLQRAVTAAVPPVADVDVSTAGGAVAAQYPSLPPVAPAPPAAALPPQSLVGPSPSAVVPEASLGQLWRLSEGLRAVHLIQVYGHAALSQGVPLDGSHRDECLDAADRLGELLAPVLAAPARGGVAGVGQLGMAVRGLRRFLRAGTAVDLIGATTVVVRELHRSLTGLLAVLDADQM
ncbi:unnamed protein product [Closterium sp. Naga37s-1]|nr:unnamed protein product [Closterium sp. Naga37s-1]